MAISDRLMGVIGATKVVLAMAMREAIRDRDIRVVTRYPSSKIDDQEETYQKQLIAEACNHKKYFREENIQAKLECQKHRGPLTPS